MTTISGTIATVLKYKGTSVWSISPEATVSEAIQLLAEKNVGALPVVANDKLIGIFSERDYTRKMARENKTSHSIKVREMITTNVFTISADETVEDAMRLMTQKRIRHLPVMQAGKMIGFVSIGDMVNWIISAQNTVIDQMEAYIAGH